ncbi:MAG: 50S ribosomal protein L13 [Candidatus Buchananbacteria bacterium]
MIKTIKIDAKNQSLGRLSGSIARILMGKIKTDYAPNVSGEYKIEVTNAAKIKFTGKKFDQKPYYHHSGYPGGLRTRKLSEEFVKRPEWVIRKAVLGMLPKNRLQKERIKRLKISA